MSIIDMILAKTDEERDAARAALHKANAEAPTDRQVIQSFLKDCTTLDGAPLALADDWSVVTLQ
jgi:hypothetical protein